MNQPSTADTLNQSNQELHKEQAAYYKQAAKQMIRAFIKKCPRDILIEVLVSDKIIQRDWMRKGTKYQIKDDGKN